MTWRSGIPGAPPGIALVLALALGLLAPVAGMPGAPNTLAASPELTLVTNATYLVRPDARLVHVSVRILARNTKPETRTHRYWFDHAYLAVQPGTSGFKLSGASGAKVTVAKRTSSYTLLRIGLGPRLYSGASRTLTLGFDLRDSGATPKAQVRIGGSLASFPVWAFSSDGATGSTVAVVFPAGYDVTVETGGFARQARTADGGTRLETNVIAAPQTWFAYVVGQREAKYAETPLSVATGDGPISLTMRAWQEDPAWARRVGGLFGKALPRLREAIGLPWPHATPTIVQEAVSRTTGGYAGVYDPTAGMIEVAYWADPLVMLHEAAHGWFNGALLADRWANEGFASLYGERVAKALKQKGSSPRLTDAVMAARIPLNAWAPQSAASDRATEAYGYAASVELARAIAERAGDDALRGVWRDAAARIGAYQPPAAGGSPGGPTAPGAAPETVATSPDWRGLLDLLEARTGKDFTDLWRTWVVREEDAPLLAARSAARTSYARTLALAGDWALPRSIRDELRAWQFDAAEGHLADARTVLAQRAAVEQRAARDGLRLPDAMRPLFEAGSMAEASREAEAELDAMLVLEGAAGERPADPDVLTGIGLMGAHPDADLAAARSAFEGGDLGAATDASDLAQVAWQGAWEEGRRRALFGLAALATALALVSAIVRGLRQVRRPVASRAGAAATASGRGPRIAPRQPLRDQAHRSPSSPSGSPPGPPAPGP